MKKMSILQYAIAMALTKTPVQLGGNKLKPILSQALKVKQGSAYRPHQGPRECARRLRQIENGTHITIGRSTIQK